MVVPQKKAKGALMGWRRRASEINLTAIHEAGHALAHYRLGIDQESVTVKPRAGILGGVRAAGVNHVEDAEGAELQVLAYCAGYAALVAAGCDGAAVGAEDDFASAEYLIEHWRLAGDIEHWKARAVGLMSEPRNRDAVMSVVGRLKRARTMGADEFELLVDLSDGEITQARVDNYLLAKARASKGT